MDKQEIMKQFHQGHCRDIYKLFGAHITEENGKKGVRFTVYAPYAREVAVVGTFNGWNGTNHKMNRDLSTGEWNLFIEGIKENDIYKYEIVQSTGAIKLKADPYGYSSELRPDTASVVKDIEGYPWHDESWMKNRTRNFDRKLNIYEAHAGSWKRKDCSDIKDPKKRDQLEMYTYLDLAKELIPYVKEMGYSHIELMPLNEHPFDGSWGYQAHGYYCVTSRYGDPKQLMYFIDQCHENGIGVILDVVPVHFVKDDFGLAYFDGTPLYEYSNPSDASSEWGTQNFDLWKEEVRSFLISNVCYWCEYYHFDGIRCDAISNLIYWGGNKSRGENSGAIDFIKRLNFAVHEKFPTVMMMAEDSSDYGRVTRPTVEGGLGFDYKWDLGWMNDTLKYYKMDPLFRKYNHNLINFSMFYFYSEKFILPFSHDEVVHGKLTILDKMWGSQREKFSQVRNLYTYMMSHPGKKLNFMGNEIAMFREWDEKKEIDWFMLKYPLHDSFKRYIVDLNKIYNEHKCFYEGDYSGLGFKWIDADNADQSIFSYYRESDDEAVVVVLNMTPNNYDDFFIGVPYYGWYKEILNSETDSYSGCNLTNPKPIRPIKFQYRDCNYAMHIKLAPFAACMFSVKKPKRKAK